MDIKTATTDELKSEKAKLNALADDVRRSAKAIQAELDFRANVEAFRAMPEAKRLALAHVIGAEGIPSGAQVGTPGSK